MLKLVVTQPGAPDLEFAIEGDAATIGRVPACDVVIDQPFVSKQHLRILSGVVAVDLGSSNGTFVDGKRLTEAVLLRGRPISLSQNGVELRVETDSGVALDTLLPGSEAELENLRSRYALLELEASKLRRELSEVRVAGARDERAARLQGENEALRVRLESMKREVEEREVDDAGSVQARLAMQRVENVQALNEKLEREVDHLRAELAARPAAADAPAGGGTVAVGAAAEAGLRAELARKGGESAELRAELERVKAAARLKGDQTEVVRKLRLELEELRASARAAGPAPDLAEAAEASRAEANELRARVAELEGRIAAAPPAQGQASDLFFKLQSENTELKRKLAALQKGPAQAGTPQRDSATRLVKELMDARLRIAALEAEISNLKVARAAAPPEPIRPVPAVHAARMDTGAGPGAGGARRTLEVVVEKDIEALLRPAGGPAEDFVLVESVRFLRGAERVVTRVAGDLIQLFQLHTMLPDTAGSYRSHVAELLANPADAAARGRLVEYLETLGRWLVASIGAHRKAAVLFAEGIKLDLSEQGLTARAPLPAIRRVPILAGDALWRRAQVYLLELSPDAIDERIDSLAREQAKTILGEPV